MKDSLDPGRSLQRNSRYYLDPSRCDGEVKIIKPADPEKLAIERAKRSKRVRQSTLFTFNNHLTKAQIQKMKDSIIL